MLAGGALAAGSTVLPRTAAAEREHEKPDPVFSEDARTSLVPAAVARSDGSGTTTPFRCGGWDAPVTSLSTGGKVYLLDACSIRGPRTRPVASFRRTSSAPTRSSSDTPTSTHIADAPPPIAARTGAVIYGAPISTNYAGVGRYACEPAPHRDRPRRRGLPSSTASRRAKSRNQSPSTRPSDRHAPNCQGPRPSAAALLDVLQRRALDPFTAPENAQFAADADARFLRSLINHASGTEVGLPLHVRQRLPLHVARQRRSDHATTLGVIEPGGQQPISRAMVASYTGAGNP